MSPSGSVELMFDILRCATMSRRVVPAGPIEIRMRGKSANRELERPRAKRDGWLDMVNDLRYVWKVRAKMTEHPI